MNMNKFSYLITTEEVLNGPLFKFQHFYVSVTTASVVGVAQGGKEFVVFKKHPTRYHLRLAFSSEGGDGGPNGVKTHNTPPPS